MRDRLVLISDDSDFFEYIVPKLDLRRSDELFRFSFSELPDKLHQLHSALLIINSESNQAKTLDLLNIVKGTPSIVFGYNDDTKFKLNAYKAGMSAYFSLMTPDEEIKASLIPALREISSLKKKEMYRELLVKNNLITQNNEVFLSCNFVLDSALQKLNQTSSEAVLIAISPDEKSKFIIQSNQIETVVLSNIRSDDIMLNYAPNKYFILLMNTGIDKAQALWKKISSHLPEPIYAGFAPVEKKSREELINEVLNNLHRAINQRSQVSLKSENAQRENFKFYREEYKKRLEQIITPAFYRIQQLYNDKLFNMHIEQNCNDSASELLIISKYIIGVFKITSPGFSTINIDISYNVENNCYSKVNKNGIKSLIVSDTKRIKFTREEFDSAQLQDLLEQFVSEFKQHVSK